MLHLEERHDFMRITCDCGNLAITLENRGRMPERMLHCGHCGAHASTRELQERKAIRSPAAPGTRGMGFFARIGASLLALARISHPA
jgi:hypothetical protein